MTKQILILGVNGFIGNALTRAILAKTDWQVTGLDLASHNLEHSMGHERFTFHQGDVTKEHAWIETQIQQCDAILPLVAIATPATYVENPLRVFELDFEANIDFIRMAVKHKTRVIFPSTSEVYGMCTDDYFNEETSQLITGPIHKQRWIYSCSKQLMDRVIYAYGVHENLDYTLFRPFNWFGPKLDTPENPNARVLTKFIGNILRGEDLALVDGGEQRRCFCYVDDAIEALLRIIENKDGCATRQIINIGNPSKEAEASIKELGAILLSNAKAHPAFNHKTLTSQLKSVTSEAHYGKGYQDMQMRRPSIEKATALLKWEPKTTLKEGLQKTLDYYLSAVEVNA